jgi:hypothetical protein
MKLTPNSIYECISSKYPQDVFYGVFVKEIQYTEKTLYKFTLLFGKGYLYNPHLVGEVYYTDSNYIHNYIGGIHSHPEYYL